MQGRLPQRRPAATTSLYDLERSSTVDRNLPKLALPALLLIATALVACGPSSPEDRVAAIRAEYTIELNSWRMLEKEPAAATIGDEDEAEEGATAEGDAAEDTAAESGAAEIGDADAGSGEGNEAAAAPASPGTDVEFDLVIYFRGRESLPGITVDITQADSSEQEKAVYRRFVDTAGIVKGETRQAAFVIEGLEIAEGDIFAASVKPGIPADLAAYQEFSDASP